MRGIGGTETLYIGAANIFRKRQCSLPELEHGGDGAVRGQSSNKVVVADEERAVSVGRESHRLEQSGRRGGPVAEGTAERTLSVRAERRGENARRFAQVHHRTVASFQHICNLLSFVSPIILAIKRSNPYC